MILETIGSPADVRALRPDQIAPLAAEIREFLVNSVSRTGGHLGPNLGVVELTIALHRVFDSPRDTIVFDTERKDIYLAGPADAFGPDATGRMLGRTSGRPVMAGMIIDTMPAAGRKMM